MDYLVSIKNNLYFSWQIELLIESFKLCKMEDQLVVGINASSEIGPKNLIAHERKFIFKEDGDSSIAQIQAILIALREGIIKPPFTVIHADTVLVKPMDISPHNISFSVDHEFLREVGTSLDSLVSPILEKKKEAGMELEKLPVGGICQFHGISDIAFQRIGATIRHLEPDFKKIANRAAWMLNFLEFVGILSVAGNYYESSLMKDLEQESFIHYTKGVPSLFHKNMFQFDRGLSLSDEPLEVILKIPLVNTAIGHLQRVVRSYKEKK
jgi:hypothetical protein